MPRCSCQALPRYSYHQLGVEQALPHLQGRRGQQAPNLGMPPLPTQPPKQSPGAAARAARQRKRKNEPEIVDERVQRLQKRMVRIGWTLSIQYMLQA